MNRPPKSTDIDLWHLRCLVVLVEAGSVTAAAARLGTSQPSVSHMLQRLRLAFDDALLVRVGLRMLPTPRAQEIAAQARELLAAAELMLTPIPPFDPATYQGRWAISMPEYVDCRLTSVLVELLSTRAPRSTLIVYPPNPGQADHMLEVGELDLRLGWVDHTSPTTRSRGLYNESFSCLMRKDHAVGRQGLNVERYIAADHVRVQVSRPSTASRAMDAAAHKLGLGLRVALVVPSLMSLARTVAVTDLIGTVPSGMAHTMAKTFGLELAPLPLKIPTLNVAMYWHERMQSDRRHRWLRTLVTEAVATLQAE